MSTTNLKSISRIGIAKMTGGTVNTLITPAISYPDKTNIQRPFIVCSFTNEGSNFSAANITSGYAVDIISRKIDLGVYEFDIKLLEDSSIISFEHASPHVSIINASVGSWNKRCIAVENWGSYNWYWRIRVLTTDAGNNKRVETHVNVVLLAKTPKL